MNKHKINYNWIMDLPFGRGKRFAGTAGSVMNRIIGGWQLAGQGSFNSNWWALPTSNWLTPNPVEIYGTKYPVKDCRSGTCYRQLPVLQRIHPGQPHQQLRRQWQAQRHHGGARKL